MRPSSVSGTTATAPGCRMYSRVADPPSGRRTLSRTTCRKWPLSSSSREVVCSTRWLSSAMGSMPPILSVSVQVAPHEAREGEREEQRAGDGVELPALRRDLARALFQQQAHAADQKIQQHQ